MYISDGVKYADISEKITIYNYYIRRDCIELVTPGGVMTIYNNDDDAELIKKWINECKKSLTRDNCPSETMKYYICNYLEFRIECGEYI